MNEKEITEHECAAYDEMVKAVTDRTDIFEDVDFEAYDHYVKNVVIPSRHCTEGDAEKVLEGKEPYHLCSFAVDCEDLIDRYKSWRDGDDIEG